MNEISIIIHFLSRISYEQGTMKIQNIGATREDLTKALQNSGKLSNISLTQHLDTISSQLNPLGLEVKYNPLNQHFFLTSKKDLQNFFQANPFMNNKRLAATLCTILSLTLIKGGKVEIRLVEETRKKKDIKIDLEELERMKFIVLEQSFVRIHPNLAYFIDFSEFLEQMDSQSERFILKSK